MATAMPSEEQYFSAAEPLSVPGEAITFVETIHGFLQHYNVPRTNAESSFLSRRLSADIWSKYQAGDFRPDRLAHDCPRIVIVHRILEQPGYLIEMHVRTGDMTFHLINGSQRETYDQAVMDFRATIRAYGEKKVKRHLESLQR